MIKHVETADVVSVIDVGGGGVGGVSIGRVGGRLVVLGGG